MTILDAALLGTIATCLVLIVVGALSYDEIDICPKCGDIMEDKPLNHAAYCNNCGYREKR